MEGKIYVYLFLILAVIGGGYGIYHTTEIDEANKEFISVGNQIGSVEKLIKDQKAYIELRKEVSALLTAASIMQKDTVTLRSEIDALKAKHIATRKDFEMAIERARQNVAGLVINNPVLPSGLRLHNARVQKLEGNVTTVVHAEGISKLTPDMLPEELRERFRFGVPVEADEPKGITQAPPATTTVAPVNSGDPIASAKQQLDRLNKDLSYLDEEFKKAEAESSSATTPTKRFYAKNRIEALTTQRNDLKTKVGEAEVTLKKLEAGQ
jgi:hypothetical protein